MLPRNADLCSMLPTRTSLLTYACAQRGEPNFLGAHLADCQRRKQDCNLELAGCKAAAHCGDARKRPVVFYSSIMSWMDVVQPK